MAWLKVLFLIFCLVHGRLSVENRKSVMEDNEFAEFEEFDDDEDDIVIVKETESRKAPEAAFSHQQQQQAKVIIEEDEDEEEDNGGKDELEEEFDEEEFEGLDQSEKVSQKGTPAEKPDLKITKVPLHLRSNWESFYLEFLMALGLVVYFINFVSGRAKNQHLATAWLNSHRQLLENNFTLVGDDGKKEIENPGFVKVSENIYTLWCSGRVCVEGMLVELKFLKRQDLVSIISNLLRPACDQMVIRVNMNVDAMENFVFCLANKKTGLKLTKEMNDLITFCPEKKPGEKFGVSSNFCLMNEIGEVATTLLDSKVVSVIKKYEDSIDYILFSDQHTGVKSQDDTQPSKLPEVKKVLLFGFSIPGRGHISADSMENLKHLLQLVFYIIDKIKRFHLSKEAKAKSDKNRQKVEEAFLKTTHAQRQEAAQQRKEDRRRAEKEKMMNEEDPDKQRKWEEREHRRELKKKAPKMKQLKVKTL